MHDEFKLSRASTARSSEFPIELMRSLQDSLGSLWFGTEDSGLYKLDPTSGTFTHYRIDSDGHFVATIRHVIEDRHRE